MCERERKREKKREREFETERQQATERWRERQRERETNNLLQPSIAPVIKYLSGLKKVIAVIGRV